MKCQFPVRFLTSDISLILGLDILRVGPLKSYVCTTTQNRLFIIVKSVQCTDLPNLFIIRLNSTA